MNFCVKDCIFLKYDYVSFFFNCFESYIIENLCI